MKPSQVFSPKFTVQQLVDQIIYFRKISRLDQRLLMSALLSKESLSSEEKNLIDRIYKEVKSGLIRVVD